MLSLGENKEVHHKRCYKSSTVHFLVVFGRKQGSVQWRIYNIVYGAHFHLNGEDFNHQQSLDISGYTEEHLEVSPELVKSAEAYKKRFNQRKNVKAVVRWVGFVLGLLFVNHILG